MENNLYIKLIWVIALLAFVVAVAGCTQKAEDKKTETQTSKEVQPVAGAQETPSETQASAECTKNTDCDDKNKCTTDSCVAGACKYITEADCEIKIEEKPHITAANFGPRSEEFVQVEGKNWLMEDWSITNSKGVDLIKFIKTSDLSNKINGKWIIYTKCGIGSGNDKYACKDNEIFSDAGDKAILKDETGTVVSTYP